MSYPSPAQIERWRVQYRDGQAAVKQQIAAKLKAAGERFPLCHLRGAISHYIDLARREPRVSLELLLKSLNEAELEAWVREPLETTPRDDYGMLPGPIESFLETLEADMATATKKKGVMPKTRTAKKKVAGTIGGQGKGKAASNGGLKDGEIALVGVRHEKDEPIANGKSATLGATAGDKTKNDPAQPSLPGMEQDRIPMIETSIKKILEAKVKRVALKADVDEAQSKLAGLLRKNGLTSYKCLGKVATIEPGADVVKIKNVKDKG